MPKNSRIAKLAACAVGVLALAACGGGDEAGVVDETAASGAGSKAGPKA